MLFVWLLVAGVGELFPSSPGNASNHGQFDDAWRKIGQNKLFKDRPQTMQTGNRHAVPISTLESLAEEKHLNKRVTARPYTAHRRHKHGTHLRRVHTTGTDLPKNVPDAEQQQQREIEVEGALPRTSPVANASARTNQSRRQATSSPATETILPSTLHARRGRDVRARTSLPDSNHAPSIANVSRFVSVCKGIAAHRACGALLKSEASVCSNCSTGRTGLKPPHQTAVQSSMRRRNLQLQSGARRLLLGTQRPGSKSVDTSVNPAILDAGRKTISKQFSVSCWSLFLRLW